MGAPRCRGVVVVVDRELRVVPDLARLLLGLHLELRAAAVLQNHAVRLRGFSKRLLAATRLATSCRTVVLRSGLSSVLELNIRLLAFVEDLVDE